jgi:hypothetical protein
MGSRALFVWGRLRLVEDECQSQVHTKQTQQGGSWKAKTLTFLLETPQSKQSWQITTEIKALKKENVRQGGGEGNRHLLWNFTLGTAENCTVARWESGLRWLRWKQRGCLCAGRDNLEGWGIWWCRPVSGQRGMMATSRWGGHGPKQKSQPEGSLCAYGRWSWGRDPFPKRCQLDTGPCCVQASRGRVGQLG